MKVLKELPLSIGISLRLLSIPSKRLKVRTGNEIPVIISLTSIPTRLKTLHLVIRNLMVQSKSPRKIVLWLETDLEDQVPSSLTKLTGERFEIRFSDRCTSAHSKLIHTLEAYPDEVIVTCDDDFLYRRNWLSLLYSEHLEHPDCIVAHHTLHINHDASGNPLPFKKWKYPPDGRINPEAVYPLGAWGVLYPPHCLSEEVNNREMFMKMAPKADDHWFKAMSLLKGTRSIRTSKRPKEPIPVINTQKVALKKENIGEGKNTVQWQALEDHYNLSDIILKGEA
ncbi:MAG: glycosyl transferase [Robiginitalea sp.]|nr:glycosyl transferase [Robiginitalea sp.]